MEVARRFFHPAEIQCLQNLAGDAQDELFFRYWSVKEMFFKNTPVAAYPPPCPVSKSASTIIGPAYFSQKTFEISLSPPVRSIPHTNASFVQRLPKNPGSFHSSSRISSCRMNNRCYSLPSV